jgi:hypothetical protein
VLKICIKCAGKSENSRRRTGRRSDPRGLGAVVTAVYRQRSDLRVGSSEHACGGDELERHGARRISRSPGSLPHALRTWRDRLEESGNEMDWRSLLHPIARAQASSVANCALRKHRLTGSGGRPVELPPHTFRSKDNCKPCLHDVDLSHSCSQAGSIARSGRSKACTNGRAATCLLPTIYRQRINRTPGWSPSINSTPAASIARRIAAKLLIEGTPISCIDRPDG